MFDYDQQNYMHRFDLWMHSLHTAVNLPRNLEDDMLYLAALFHDIGKPESRCRSKRPEDRNTHYYGHPKKSVEIIDTIIIPDLDRKGYKIPCLDVKRLFYYVRHHVMTISASEKRGSDVIWREFRLKNFRILCCCRWQMQGRHVPHPMVVERIASSAV
ncbi:MAG: HD domain-containing protein [Mediterraneibacter gnavus]